MGGLGICEFGNKRHQVEKYWKNDWFYEGSFKGRVGNCAIGTPWNLTDWLYQALSNGDHEFFTGYLQQASGNGINWSSWDTNPTTKLSAYNISWQQSFLISETLTEKFHAAMDWSRCKLSLISGAWEVLWRKGRNDWWNLRGQGYHEDTYGPQNLLTGTNGSF